MVLLTFALPDEASDFVAGLERRAPLRRGPLAPVSGECAGVPVTVVYTGVGAAESCRRRLEEFLVATAQKPRLVIGSGFAGGLAPAPRVGDLILGENHSGPALAAAAADLLRAENAGRLHRGAISTQPVMAETVAAKAALHAVDGSLAVDMETAWIAGACGRAGVPMVSLRVISDAAEQPFPVPGHILFDQRRQRPRYVALPLWLLTHPGQIGPFARFVGGLGPARARLAGALRRLVVGLPMA